MNWENVPLRKLITPNTKRNRPDLPLLSVVRDKGIIKRNLDRSDNHNVIPEDLSNYKVVSTGQFVINKMKAWQGSCGVSPYDGIVSPAYFVFDLNIDNPRFFNYSIRSRAFIAEFNRLSKGIRVDQWDLELDKLKYVRFPLPPRDEQDQIVRYLDWKVSGINRLINAKRRQIVLLQEQKQAVINEAVTKGSEGWRPSYIKREFINLDYMRRPVEASVRSQKGEVLYDYYGASGVVDKIDDYIFDQTTLLIAEDGANLVLRNLPLIYIAKGKYWVNNHAHILVPNEYNDMMFMAYLLESIDYTVYITGAAQPKLSQNNLGRVPLCVPTLAEQQEIATHLDTQCARINKVIEALNEEIALFAEYRTRLISDVVTGKLDVRGVVVPEFEAVEDMAEDNKDTEEMEDTDDI